MNISKINTPLCMVGEGPVWDIADQALYFIDILGKKVLRFDPASGETRTWDVPDIIGSMAIRAGGGAIVMALMAEMIVEAAIVRANWR